MYHDGDSGAFDADFSCRWLMLKNHDFVDGSRRCIIVVRISNHGTETTTEEHHRQNCFQRLEIEINSSKEQAQIRGSVKCLRAATSCLTGEGDSLLRRDHLGLCLDYLSTLFCFQPWHHDHHWPHVVLQVRCDIGRPTLSMALA